MSASPFFPAIVHAEDASKCQEVLATELANQGVEWSTLQGPKWVEETLVSSPGQLRVSGYQFYAVPAGCTRGRLVARMDADCRITKIYTRRGCTAGTVRAR